MKYDPKLLLYFYPKTNLGHDVIQELDGSPTTHELFENIENSSELNFRPFVWRILPPLKWWWTRRQAMTTWIT